MKRAGIGIRVHSGWGALVAVSGDSATVEVIDRRRIVVADPTIAGANQPYHLAQKQEIRDANKYLANCTAVSERLALAAIRDVVQELRHREYLVMGCAILLASGRSLPSLAEILASHALIHAAEGEFFRNTFWKACQRLDVHVTGIRERELDGRAKIVFGRATNRLRREIANLGSSLGPPWTTDQKASALAASMVLAGEKRLSRLPTPLRSATTLKRN